MVCALLVSAACGTPSAARPLAPRSGEAAAEDLRGLVAFVEAVHPDPYRFTTQSDFARLAAQEDEALRALSAPSEIELGRAMQRVLAALHDSHAAVALPVYQPDAVASQSVLPLLIDVIDGEAYVDASVGDLPEGAQVLAIDGRAFDEVQRTLLGLVLADGVAEGPRVRVLEDELPKHYLLAYGMQPSYQVELRTGEGETITREVAGVSVAQAGALRRERRSVALREADAGERAAPRLTNPAPGVAVLRLASFGEADADRYAAEVDALFARLSDVHTLVLDLRGNRGGDRSLGAAVINHLVARPYVQWLGASTRVQRMPDRFEASVGPAFGVPLEGLLRFSEHAADGRYHLRGDPLAARMQPKAPHFDGRVLVWADGLTNSAANELVLGLLSVRPDVTLIGSELGGECQQHIGEQPVLYTTEHYGITIALSLARVEHVPVAGCSFGRGLVPARTVVESVDDLVSGQDPYLRSF